MAAVYEVLSSGRQNGTYPLFDETSGNWTYNFTSDDTISTITEPIHPNPTVDSILQTIYACNESPPLGSMTRAAFWIDTVLIGTLCVFGVIGNTLSIVVLQKDNNNKVAVFMLQALAITDNAFLVNSFVFLSVWFGLLPVVQHGRLSDTALYLPIVGNPLGSITQTATVWMTVILAGNRYIAICRPFHAAQICTLAKAKLQVAAVAVFSVCFNLPRFFQSRIVEVSIDSAANATTTTSTRTMTRRITQTSIGYSTTFGKVYTNALYTILVLILPLIILSVLNVKLIRELRASRVELRRTSASSRAKVSGAGDNISYVMVVIVVVFLCCHAPDRVLALALLITPPKTCDMTVFFSYHFTNLLVIVNSSTNFVIYFVFRKRFRRILREHICAWFTAVSAERGEKQSLSAARADQAKVRPFCVPQGLDLDLHSRDSHVNGSLANYNTLVDKEIDEEIDNRES